MPLAGTHRRWLDLFLIVLAAGEAVSVATADEPHRVSVTLLSALSLLVLLGRHRAPFSVSVGAFALLAIANVLAPTSTALQFVGMLVLFAAAGAINRGRQVLAAAAAGVGLLVLATLVVPTGGGWPDFLLSSTICLGLLAAGWLLARRSRQLDHARAEYALVARREQERARTALVEERARIARELHDVVSHALSVVVVQGQAARSAVEDLPTEEPGRMSVLRHLDAVESTARDALGEMRRMLGLLQLDGVDSSDQGLEPPSPGLPELPTLVERARLGGLAITAQLPPAPLRLASGLGLTVYRIVQESLTNVVRHAPAAATTLEVAQRGDRLEVRVRNVRAPIDPGVAATGAGRGLVGMRERVAMYDGRLNAGPTSDGGFEVHVVLPLEAGFQPPDSALSSALESS